MANRIAEIKRKIAKLASELHQEFHSEYAEWYPKFPWVLVYILPREQRAGKLWVPGDTKNQNKVTLEGVVVRLWKAEHIPYKTDLKIGDHVLFPHFAGQPFANRSAEEFRVIKEDIPRFENGISDGHIFAKVNYSSKKIETEFMNLVNFTMKDLSKEAFQVLSRNFIIYPKESKTLSGM